MATIAWISDLTDCNQISIESSLIDDYIADQTNKTLTLVSKYVCNTEYSETLELADLDVPNSRYVLQPTYYSSTATKFTDGIYSYSVVLTESGTDQTDNACFLIACSLKCDVVEYLADSSNSLNDRVVVATSYERLDDLATCNQCDCENACVIYTELCSILKTTGNCEQC